MTLSSPSVTSTATSKMPLDLGVQARHFHIHPNDSRQASAVPKYLAWLVGFIAFPIPVTHGFEVAEEVTYTLASRTRTALGSCRYK